MPAIKTMSLVKRYKSLTAVEENLELICGIHGFSKEKTKAKMQALSEQFSLNSVLHRKAGKLSGGWQRRVSIAMALPLGELSREQRD